MKNENAEASLVYLCPKTNKKIQTKIGYTNSNLYAYSCDYYGSQNCYIKIYKCKSCTKEHIIDLN